MELNIGDKIIVHIKTDNGGSKETAIHQKIEAVVFHADLKTIEATSIAGNIHLIIDKVKHLPQEDSLAEYQMLDIQTANWELTDDPVQYLKPDSKCILSLKTN